MNILIYGDSNTYGETAFAESRLRPAERWAGLLNARLDSGSTVVAEGFSGRTAGDLQSGWEGLANGQEHFTIIYGSHTPIDLLIIALGTNDCKQELEQTPAMIARNLSWYRRQAELYHQKNGHGKTGRVAYLIPPPYRSNDFFTGQPGMRDELRKQLLASDLSVIDTPGVALSNDGVHFAPAGHETVAEVVFDWIKKEEMK